MKKLTLILLAFTGMVALAWKPLDNALHKPGDGGKVGIVNRHYDFSCMSSEHGSNKKIRDLNDLANTYLESISNISIDTIVEWGKQFHKQMVEVDQLNIQDYGPKYEKIKKIMKELIKVQKDPRGIPYTIHFVKDDETVNAFTAFGQIYFFSGIMNMCETDDEIYALIGHEIGHNEMGHLDHAMMAQMLAGSIGKNAVALLALKKSMTPSLNQRNEMEADFYGLELLMALKKDPCKVVKFWRRMSKQGEGPETKVTDFFRTHPFSDERANCVADHTQKVYGITCK